MARILKEQDIREILVGVAFLGAGGGGGLKDGLIMLEDNVKLRGKVEVTLIDPDEISDGGHAVMVAGTGSPRALAEKKEKFRYETSYAFDAMKDLAYFSGKRIDAIVPGEMGAVTSFIPMVACMEKGVPIVDADGCGRAVPGLDVTMFHINDIPYSPGVATSDTHDVIAILPKNPLDYKEAENILRHLCGAYGYVIGMASSITSKEDVQNKLVPGGLTLAQNVGKAILTAKENKACIKATLKEAAGAKLLAEGIVASQEYTVKNGHDIGCTTLKADDGNTYYADIKNETMLFRTDDAVLVTCPDLICCIDLESYTPLTNAAIEKDMRVAYFAIPAHELWYRSAKVEQAWKPYFEAVGYTGGIVRCQ
ncbi:DUF917 domain-containing protein [Christensenellaceae bacterium OttesenSCG-928-M15]|nr:DUF917 domain-containing protein [Christensenellaceae bacterium OttesenSCG-928-M15]